MCTAASKVLLAETWSEDVDPTGWWMSEKLDGVRYVLVFVFLSISMDPCIHLGRIGMAPIFIRVKETSSMYLTSSRLAFRKCH